MDYDMPSKVRNVGDFLAKVGRSKAGSARNDGLLVLRGQSKAWPCVPGIARKPYTPAGIYTNYGQMPKPAEYRLFVRFRDTTVPYQPAWVQVPSITEFSWRQLVLAQHYGLPTRLLDWTTMPLVALYFAVEEEQHHRKDGVIYEFPANLKSAFTVAALARHNPNPPLYDYNADVGLLWPPDVDSRVTAQGSVFTISQTPWVPVMTTPKYVVPIDYKSTILHELRRLGITRSHLFPDMGGAARSIKEESATWDPTVGVVRA